MMKGMHGVLLALGQTIAMSGLGRKARRGEEPAGCRRYNMKSRRDAGGTRKKGREVIAPRGEGVRPEGGVGSYELALSG
jgi:hypothetical protein